VTLFTVQLELGPEARAMIERMAKDATMHLEFGPKTREALESLFPKEPNKRDGGEGLLRKGADALRK
jgi:hypothetical protein